MPHKSAEARAAYGRAYREKNSAALAAYKAAYRISNCAAIAADQRMRYLADRPARIAKATLWASMADPVRIRAMKTKCHAKRRAYHRGLDFNLTLAWVYDRLRRGVCEATGVPFDFADPSLQATIDRRDNDRGYTDDNCWVVTRTFNSAKADRPLASVSHLLKQAA